MGDRVHLRAHHDGHIAVATLGALREGSGWLAEHVGNVVLNGTGARAPR
jgi:hypothetical protein